MQPPQLVPVPVAPVKFQAPIKAFYQPMRCVQVGADRNYRYLVLTGPVRRKVKSLKPFDLRLFTL
jgi:hypothetical protein